MAISTETLDADNFSQWLESFIGALKGEHDADVPCGDCVGCCTSAHFVHIKPSDTETLKHIPEELLFPAPGMAEGIYLLGYDEQGHCPMFRQGQCSIYPYRPETCRQYDCRVYTATGLSLDKKSKPVIQQRVEQWRFSFASDRDKQLQAALQSAAQFIGKFARQLPQGTLPSNTPQQAILAICIHDLFLGLDSNDIYSQQDELLTQVVARVVA